MRFSFAQSSAVIFLICATILRSPEAQSTSFVQLTHAQMVDASDAVVRGVVTDLWTEPHENGTIWTHAQIEISDILKGDNRLAVVVIQQPGGVWGDQRTTVAGSARFSVGEEGFFFIAESKTGRLSLVGMYQGKFNILMDPYSREEIVRQVSLAPNTHYDHRFIPLPSEDARISAIDFADQITERVEVGWDGQSIPGTSRERLLQINNVQEGVQ